MDNSENPTVWQKFTNFDRSFFYREIFFPLYRSFVEMAIINAHGDTDIARSIIADRFENSRPSFRSQVESDLNEAKKKLYDDSGNLSVSALLDALKNTDHNVRRVAVRTLGNTNDVSVIPILADVALSDNDSRVRVEATNALANISDNPLIISYGNSLGNSVEEVRVNALIRALEDRAEIVRIVANQSLPSCADPKVAHIFAQIIMDSKFVRVWENAGDVLIKIGEPAVPVIIPLLFHPDWDVRANAAMLLGEIRSGKAIPRLVFMLKDPHRYVRENAAQSLGKIGALAAVPNLVEALTDNKENVRAKALEALESMVSRCSTQEHCEVTLDALNAGERFVKSCSGNKKGIDITIPVARLKCAVTEKLKEHEQMRKECEELTRERFTKMIFKAPQSFKIENRQLKRAVNG